MLLLCCSRRHCSMHSRGFARAAKNKRGLRGALLNPQNAHPLIIELENLIEVELAPARAPHPRPLVDWSSFTSRLAKAQRLLSEQHRLRRAHPRTGGRAKCEKRPRKRPHRRRTPTGSDNLATFANNPRGYLLKHGRERLFWGDSCRSRTEPYSLDHATYASSARALRTSLTSRRPRSWRGSAPTARLDRWPQRSCERRGDASSPETTCRSSWPCPTRHAATGS
jgi:hypothetical protein